MLTAVNDDLVTVPEAATRLRVDQETIRRWLRSGRLQGINLGPGKGRWRIRAAELDRFLIEREQQSRG